MAFIDDVRQSISRLEEGFCLWVGAGLTIQLTGDPALTPDWNRLTSTLEETAQIGEESNMTFPARLQRCADVLKEDFYDALRKLYYADLCHRILEIALTHVLQPDSISSSIVPKGIRRIACLGQLANPIVNFNIEPLSSIALARPGGPVRLLSYTSKGASLTVGRSVQHASFRRIAYHPHGLILDGGGCVMTAQEYEDKQASLAFELAVTSAFGQDLAIVGLGLSERETQDQIKKYRDDLSSIIWFTTTEFADKQEQFCEAANIEVVRLRSWPTFWEIWDDIGVALSESGLHQAWHTIVAEAAEECSGGRAGTLAALMSKHDKTQPLVEDIESFPRDLGEQRQVRTVDGRSPSEVVGMLEESMRTWNYEIQYDPVSFSPRRTR